jgi:NAD dependent epimerase/dehydratase family enzyme
VLQHEALRAMRDACLARAGINFIGSQGVFLLLLKILKNTNNGSRVGDGDFHSGWILISQGFLSVDSINPVG